jgi:hypothetical protein
MLDFIPHQSPYTPFGRMTLTPPKGGVTQTVKPVFKKA